MNLTHYDMIENISYGLLEEKFYNGEAVRCSYGIAVYANARQGGVTCVLETVSDITSGATLYVQPFRFFNVSLLDPKSLMLQEFSTFLDRIG